ncbi:oxygenase MpaB family protein [uncultured Massilia sp.]|uniref:oxygenase MpaB family protein n=1 Tax=uncultured Massilia sp. TaxID=169973 RepID=UPI0025EFF2AE|nr:oxygenase MpaB family protein [uncultured Massilia sp.]
MRDDPTPSADDPCLRADPLADATIARALGPAAGGGPDLDAIALLNGEIARWKLNGDLDGWCASPGLPPHMAAALEDYVAAARVLPAWADPAAIARAEALFMDMSMASCTLLFCASLPQCYVVPDLAAVLHVAGQLEQHTDYRVRSTAAMIFPVMMRGGMTAPDGGGIAQALKVRLIHATIRHLVLRGAPADAMVAPRRLPRIAARGAGLHHLLYAQGWDIDRLGLPCNQEELAYTLLTFGYVFVDGMRRLGIPAASADEAAYLHAWNVLGHVLGIERALMADTMDRARALFEDIQARNRDSVRRPDPRPALAADLVAAMQRYIPLGLLKPFPVLLTRRLCGARASRDLGLDGKVSLPARLAFAACAGLARGLDALARPLWPGFSLARLATRVLGYHLTVRLLMDQTRPLKLPDALLDRVHATVQGWQADPRAPRWMVRLEDRLTGRSGGRAR